MSLTPAEIALVEKLGEAFAMFDQLPPAHDADRSEFILHTHALQNIVMSRSAQRSHPDKFWSRLDEPVMST